MGKEKFRIRLANLKTIGSAIWKLVNSWSKTFSSQGRHVIFTAKKIISSINRQICSFFKDAALQCRKAAIDIKHKNLRRFYRLSIATKEFVDRAQQVCKKFVRGCNEALNDIKAKAIRLYQDLALECNKNLAVLKTLWLEAALSYRKVGLGVKRAFKPFLDFCQSSPTALQRATTQWQRTAFAHAKKQMKLFLYQIREKLPARAQQINFNFYGSKPWIGLFVVCLFAVVGVIFSTKKNRTNGSIALAFKTSPLSVKLAARLKARKSTSNENPSGYSFWPKRFTLRHVKGWGAGVSYGTNYTTAAMMIAPDYRVGRILPIVDVRGHRFDNDTYAANIGIAGRYIPSPDTFCQILGMNLFYDWRQGRKGNYQQIGLGLEMLGKRWDLRANGYAPISRTQYKTKCTFHYPGDFFAIHRDCEFISYGLNGEVGYYLVRNESFLFYAATGPYFLVRKCHDSTLGWEFRIRPQYKDSFALDFSVSHDHVFQTVYQAQIIFYLPLYKLSKKLNKRPCGLSDQQIYQPIERFEVMPLGRRSCWQRNF